jgi:hypothetical protein
MRRRALALSGATLAATLSALSSSTALASSVGNLGNAQEVPSVGTHNSGRVISVSCASAGNCAAGGQYTDGSNHDQGFVVDEVNGTWGYAQEVPNLRTLNVFGSALVAAVSCASAGNCAAGGSYLDGSSHFQGFVVEEVNGTWGEAEKVPNLGTLNANGAAHVESVSCSSAGNCAAGGPYLDGSNHYQGFVVDEVNGTWGYAQEVPNLGTLNVGGDALMSSVSCASAGNCAAGGYYLDGPSGNYQGFVVDDVNGTWGQAKEVPNLGTLNVGGGAEVGSISCASAGNCAAGGSYASDGVGGYLGFVDDEVNGTWGQAQEVPPLGTPPDVNGEEIVASVSCASAGNCAAVGYYADGSIHNYYQGFVVDEVNGTWGYAQEVPNLGTLNVGGSVYVASVSCASAGNCAAGGYYTDGSSGYQGFVVDEVNGTWGNAQEVPNLGTLNVHGAAQVISVSCASAGNCAAGGSYLDGSGIYRGFADDEVNRTWSNAHEMHPYAVPAAPQGTKVTPGLGKLTVSWLPPSSNGGLPITRYTARAANGASTLSCVASRTSCVILGVRSTIPYTVSVTATNAVGTGPAGTFGYAVYAVASSMFALETLPLVVQTKTYFTLLAYGATPGKIVTFGIPGSVRRCKVDPVGQCWASARVYKTGVWKAVATIGKMSATTKFYAPLVKVPLQVRHGTKMVTTISSAPPDCKVSEVVAGKTYRTTASNSGKATLRVKVTTVGVLSVTVTIDGTKFKPYSVDVT